jgi:hypothetical protein
MGGSGTKLLRNASTKRQAFGRSFCATLHVGDTCHMTSAGHKLSSAVNFPASREELQGGAKYRAGPGIQEAGDSRLRRSRRVDCG